ncbi:MAG: hypothetical protein WBI63_06565 [Coriobacteriia bacterium]
MRTRRSPLGYVFVIAGVLVLLGIVLAAALRPQSVPANADATVIETAVPSSTPAPGLQRDATPMLANYRSLYLRLPIDPSKITQVAFHQASGDKAFHMTALVPDADMVQAAKLKHAPLSTAASGSAETSSGASSIWNGTVLRLWRSNRRGTPDTAIDVGTEPGTDVYSPVTGTVLQVRPYKLYNKHADYEIHIKPDGWADVDVVLIHVDDVSVVAGDRVLGGITRIACVRKMSDRVDLQLGGYTRNGGDHVHVQLNQVDVPGKLEELTGS